MKSSTPELTEVVPLNADQILIKSVARLMGKNSKEDRGKAITVNVPTIVNATRGNGRVHLGPIDGNVDSENLSENLTETLRHVLIYRIDQIALQNDSGFKDLDVLFKPLEGVAILRESYEIAMNLATPEVIIFA